MIDKCYVIICPKQNKPKLVRDAGNIETMCMCLVSAHHMVALHLTATSCTIVGFFYNIVGDYS
jgi:hypothetical protein